jgi:hypothetical protein
MQEHPADFSSFLSGFHLPLSSTVALALKLALTPQQLAVDLGDPFQLFFQLVVVVDPTTDLIDLIGRNDPAGCSSWPEGHRQIPAWSVPFPLGTLARWIATGDISLYQRPSENVGDWRQLLGQTLFALAKGQFRDSAELVACLHLKASLHQISAFNANANVPSANFLLLG